MIARRISEETESVAYFNIILPMELMMHHRMLAGFLKKQGYDIRNLLLEGVEEAANKYSPHYHLTELKKKYQLPNVALSEEEKEGLNQEISDFLKRFGHFSDSGNDCSKIPWRETPELVLKMIEMAAEPVKEDERVKLSALKLPMLKKGFYGAFYRRTSRYAVLRESISSLYTFGYGQFRNVFVKMGRALVTEGLLSDQEDIYYLYWKELEELIDEKKTLPLKELVRQRKEELVRYEKMRVPEIIVGKEQPPCQEDTCEDYRGIPTSLGVYLSLIHI
jgi:pyruvate,water dikinase